MVTETYKDAHSFLRYKGRELLTLGSSIRTSNSKNTGTMKEELVELPHQFVEISNSDSTIFNLPSFKTVPWWMVGEIITEFLNLNPPLMSKYRDDLVKQSYKLQADGTIEYMYGSRWKEFNQIENVRKKLVENPTSKRCIISTWMPYDTQCDREDVPCNVNYKFLGRNGKLDMTASIRSNDIMRGSKYDYFLASFMQQSMAALTGMDLGSLYLFIDSLHYYKRDESALEKAVGDVSGAQSISLRLPHRMEVDKFWSDLRHIKKAEEAAYNHEFVYCDKHISDINYGLFRDFARIMAIKNATTLKDGNRLDSYKSAIENQDVKRWF